MVTQEEMEDMYGPLAAHREHNPGSHITYRLPREKGDYHGTIVWAVEASTEVPMHYLVAREEPGGFGLDIVFPAFILS
jgi:hypothetical protein